MATELDKPAKGFQLKHRFGQKEEWLTPSNMVMTYTSGRVNNQRVDAETVGMKDSSYKALSLVLLSYGWSMMTTNTER